MVLRQQIIDSNKRFSVAITGGGTAFINSFLSPGGASSVFNGAFVPYNQKMFDDFAGKPKKYCSREAALNLAISAYKADESNDFSVGVTCTLKKNVEERIGREHHVHIVIYSKERCCYYTHILSPKMNRQSHEGVVEKTIYRCIEKFLYVDDNGISFTLDIKLNEHINKLFTIKPTTLFKNLDDILDSEHVSVNPGLDNLLIYPGSFNPYHAAHAVIAAKAQEKIKKPLVYEICVNNVDKSHIDIFDLYERCSSLKLNIGSNNHILISNRALFKDKLYPAKNCTAVVGMDTMLRIADLKYYQNWDFQDFIASLKDNNNRFLVVHRLTSKDDISNILPIIRPYCDFMTIDKKYQKISSSKIRNSR